MNKKNGSHPENPEQVFNRLLGERLASTIFEVSDDGKEHLLHLQSSAILELLSITDLSGDLSTYKRLVGLEFCAPISLMDASFFLNAASKLSPLSLGLTVQGYVKFIEINDEVVKEWNAIVMPMKTSAMREVQAKMSRQIAIPKKQIHLP